MQYCAFNVTKQSFISLGVAIANTPYARICGLARRTQLRSDEALWVVPSHGFHAIGIFSWVDVLYLDADARVVHAIDNVRPLRIPRIIRNCASILRLPARRISDSGTQIGDQLLIGSPEDLNTYWEAQASECIDRVRSLLVKEQGVDRPRDVSETYGD